MKKSWKAIIAFMTASIILACSLVSSASPAPAAQPAAPVSAPSKTPAAALANTPAPVPTDTAAPQGVPVSSANVTFVIPQGLASNVLAETVPAVSEQDGAPWEVSPAYLRFTLQNYPLQGKFFTPQIMVYPAQDYAAVGAGASISIQRLQAILASPNATLTNAIMPRLPYVNADQVIGAQAKVITFKNGSGLRVLAEYAQNFTVIDNHDLFYHFEGLTSDGKYYIVTTLPANAAFLAADSNPASPVPSDGIPFPGYDAMNADTFNSYLQKVGDKLNATSAEAFTPSLQALDALIQSISVQ